MKEKDLNKKKLQKNLKNNVAMEVITWKIPNNTNGSKNRGLVKKNYQQKTD